MKELLTTIALSAFQTMVEPGTTFAQEPKAFDSLQMKGVAVVNVPADADAAAKRLSSGVKFPTISNQDRQVFDEQAFKDWQAFLVRTYPLAHGAMKRELVGDPRAYSLLYTWTGTDENLAPRGAIEQA